MLIIPERLVTYIDMPVEDALSMIVSSGSVLPESLKEAPGENREENKKARFSPFRKRTVR